MSISTPTLLVNNSPPANHPANTSIIHNHLNQQFQQPSVPQVGLHVAPQQQYNPQIPPPYFPHNPPTNSPSMDSKESLLVRVFHRQMDMTE